MVAVAMVTIVSIVRAGATSLATSRLGAVLAWLLGLGFLGGLLGLLLLDLIEHAIRSIDVLALLEEANERSMIVSGQGFMRLRILELMLPGH